MTHIFLAHASEDKEEVIRLYDRLQQQGYKPWLDKKDLLAGQNWRSEIPKAIKNSDIFIACLSKRSVAKKGYIQKEFKMALNKYGEMSPESIYLIPLRLDDCVIPEIRQDDYGINLRDLHWVDFFEPNGFNRLIASIEFAFPNTSKQVSYDVTPSKSVKASSFIEQLGIGLTLDMAYIPGGNFSMGSPEDEAGRTSQEGPLHEVTVPAFYMGKYPVTQRQWHVISLLDAIEIELNPESSFFKDYSHPVEDVNWYEAVEFCRRLSKHTGNEYRLPTEAEWEYACRAGTATPFSLGASIGTDQANYRCTDNKGYDWSDTYEVFRKKTTKVEHFEVTNAYGLCDMHGNVWEWCQDHWHGDYKSAPTDGSAWLTDNPKALRVRRGGSWLDGPRACRSASRVFSYPDDRFIFVGFRVVCASRKTFQ